GQSDSITECHQRRAVDRFEGGQGGVTGRAEMFEALTATLALMSSARTRLSDAAALIDCAVTSTCGSGMPGWNARAYVPEGAFSHQRSTIIPNTAIIRGRSASS